MLFVKAGWEIRSVEAARLKLACSDKLTAWSSRSAVATIAPWLLTHNFHYP
jgi:hypothetical protein